MSDVSTCASLTFLRHMTRYVASSAWQPAASAAAMTATYSEASFALMNEVDRLLDHLLLSCALPSITHTSSSSTRSANSVARSISLM